MGETEAFEVDVPSLGDIPGFHVTPSVFRHALEEHAEWADADLPALLSALFAQDDVRFVYETRLWGFRDALKATPHITLFREVSAAWGFRNGERVVVPCLLICDKAKNGYIQAKTIFVAGRNYPKDRGIDHAKYRPCADWDDL